MKEVPFAVADPDLQIKEGPGHPDPEIMGRGGGRGEGCLSPKKIFTALRASVWSNNKGGVRGVGRAPGPSPGHATVFVNTMYMKGVPSLPKMVFKKVS